jgi:hypothetical protein
MIRHGEPGGQWTREILVAGMRPFPLPHTGLCWYSLRQLTIIGATVPVTDAHLPQKEGYAMRKHILMRDVVLMVVGGSGF